MKVTGSLLDHQMRGGEFPALIALITSTDFNRLSESQPILSPNNYIGRAITNVILNCVMESGMRHSNKRLQYNRLELVAVRYQIKYNTSYDF